MKNLICVTAMSLFFQSLSFAGGSSTVGPGTPWWVYDCYDQSKQIRVLILRSWPHYDKDIMFVNQDIDHQVSRIEADKPGAPLQFLGQKNRLSIQNTVPQFINGKIYYHASLQDLSDANASELPMMCQPDVVKERVSL